MRATLNIPDELIEKVQDVAKTKTKTEAIVIAMEDYIRRHKIKKLIALKGKINIEDHTTELDSLESEELNENKK